jgi:hypothetical protein
LIRWRSSMKAGADSASCASVSTTTYISGWLTTIA